MRKRTQLDPLFPRASQSTVRDRHVTQALAAIRDMIRGMGTHRWEAFELRPERQLAAPKKTQPVRWGVEAGKEPVERWVGVGHREVGMTTALSLSLAPSQCLTHIPLSSEQPRGRNTHYPVDYEASEAQTSNLIHPRLLGGVYEMIPFKHPVQCWPVLRALSILNILNPSRAEKERG